ncbi:RNA polymerase sigma factor [Micromonospora sp. NPDC048935]|uniref:RNA polymerase sigma factor n=1 Tax=Micromonospora sp. NPDC048935 TaxID=3364262 RepID=UPI0037146943
MDGSEDRFTELYERYHGDVWRYVARRVVGPDVGDVVAEVFLVAWRRLREVPAESALPWLYGVARLVLANEARGRRRWRELTLRVAAEPDQSVMADHADEVISQRDVAMALDRVPDLDREVLRLVAWERLSAAEAAVVLGCSRATFAMRLMRARRRLRSQLSVVGLETGQASHAAPSMSNWSG